VLPLDGVRVLDLTHALAGPYCTMLLGDLGADVIKVEPPGEGDHSRHWGPPFYPRKSGDSGRAPTLPPGVPGESSYFLSVNRNKRSVALDLKTDAGRCAAQDLAAASDVVVENFKPGTAARLGLGYEDLSAKNGRLIYASISGFGQSRPTLAGYDQIVQGTAGLMSITGFPDGPPIKLGVPIGDIGAGMFAAHAILAALYERERTGHGRRVDVALNDSILALLTFQAGRYFATGEPPRREGNHHPTIAPYGTFATADGFINLAVGSDDQFRRFCEAIGAPELAADQRFASNRERQRRRPELTEAIEARLRERTTAEWLPEMEKLGVPAGPIHDLAQAFADPVAVERGMRVELQHPSAGPISVTGVPWKLDNDAAPIRRPPPRLGEHTAEVLMEVAGYDAERIRALTV
jgi:crotonobetainyl-CoA:carnitine CoA-transferase CaiB-like acyl-CoA transferase